MIYNSAGDPVFSAWRYHLQVSTDPEFNAIYESADTNNHCWTPTVGYSDRTYYWRVAMYDGDGRKGPYSLPATFTKQYPNVELLSPINGQIPNTPTFVWSPVQGAASYIFEVSRYPSFYLRYDAQETMNTRYTPIWNYAANKVYYWRVAIRDADGKQGPFSTSRVIIGEVFFTFFPFSHK
jgi:hypothetical protein